MDRRHFCKIASLAAVALGSGTVKAENLSGEMSRKSPRDSEAAMPADCRISIIRREFHPDLQALFLEDADAGPCQLYEADKSFQFERGECCPDGFCPLLWMSVCNVLSSKPCSLPLEKRVNLVACPDGTRPVIVRVDIC